MKEKKGEFLVNFLQKKAYNLRKLSLLMTSQAGSGHPTSCLSAADIVAVLFFYAMCYDPKSKINPNNDRFILSKGHAAPLLYAAWQQVGVISEQDLYSYRKMGSFLEGHPTTRFLYSEAATGSLGIGLSIGLGQAMAAKLDNLDYITYVLLGDSEIAEGSVWEAAELASYYKLNNLVAILDCNRLGQSTETMHGWHTERYEEKFKAFGWETIVVDGHDINELMHAFDKIKHHTSSCLNSLRSEVGPVIIIAKTIKGYGIESIANKLGYHGKALPSQMIAGKEILDKEISGKALPKTGALNLEMAIKELDEKFEKAKNFDEIEYEREGFYSPNLPQKPSKKYENNFCESLEIEDPIFKPGENLATRFAFGNALAKLGNNCNSIVCLDAEVKNSTYTDIFESKHKDRFIQCFIAEQNMVGMAVGLQERGKIPFVSTFAAFMSRAHDQIRMAAVGNSKIKLVGSHAGVSIGQDGPSQMGLEDIAIMRCLPESIVLYPCDAISTYKLVEKMARYDKGISYLRTTRMETPVIYNFYDTFEIGKFKVLRNATEEFLDQVCIVACGVTVFEAIKAYDILQSEGIFVSVIDLYSVKPLDRLGLMDIAKKSGNKIITVEDHYIQGGIGEAVCSELADTEIKVYCLAVKNLPISGKPEELLAWAGIDANAIVAKVREICK